MIVGEDVVITGVVDVVEFDFPQEIITNLKFLIEIEDNHIETKGRCPTKERTLATYVA